MILLVPLTCLVNGVGFDYFLKTSDGSYALVVTTGCEIGIDAWYIVFTVLCGVKLLVQLLRYLYTRTNNKESVLLNLGGNYIMLPLLFIGFFVYTQRIFENSTPDSERIMTVREAVENHVKPNACLVADPLSKTLFAIFQLMAVFSYFIAIYYIVSTTMLLQSYCLIKAIVSRRITMLRRRDLQDESTTGNLGELQQELDREIEEQEENIFMNGMFGGLLSIPLPIPEILSSLDRTKYKEIIQVRKERQRQKATKNLENFSEKDGGIFKQCPICWSDFKRHHMVTPLLCNEKHIFHSDCIEKWIRKGNNSCPLCR